MTTAREAALKALVKTEKDNSYVNLALPSFLQNLPDREKAFARNITYGTVQHLNTIDWVIALYLRKSLFDLTPFIRNILRSGVYQVLFLDNLPPQVSVDEAVKLSYRYGHKGVAGLVNAVLRKVVARGKDLPWPDIKKDPSAYISLYYSFPVWMVQRWISNLGLEDTLELCRAYNKIPPLTLRANNLKVSSLELSKLLTSEGVNVSGIDNLPEGLKIVKKTDTPLNTLNTYRKGFFTVQSEPSMIVGRLMAPLPGKKVIDICSAPGGKTTHLAEIMENRGIIFAGDIHEKRLKIITHQARRLGINIINTQLWDGTEIKDNWGPADYVLCDAPCSGLGVLNRKPDLKWHKTDEQIIYLGGLQRKLLNSAASLVKSGGKLLYSVCTNEPEETRDVVNDFILRNPSFVPGFIDQHFAENEKNPGILNFYPHIHQKDGFYIALFQKQ